MNGQHQTPAPGEKEIFFEAVELHSTAERAAFLDRACAGDTALRRKVEALLASHFDPDSFMEESAAKFSPEDTEGPGSIIGRYKLCERIGEGGCGVVYLAEQE